VSQDLNDMVKAALLEPKSHVVLEGTHRQNAY
jgi:hypothetical protein